MASIITTDKDWLKGIAIYLGIGAKILQFTNIPTAMAIEMTKTIFDVWRQKQKKTLLTKRKPIDTKIDLERETLLRYFKERIIINIYNDSPTQEQLIGMDEIVHDIKKPISKKERKGKKKREKKSKKNEDVIPSKLKIPLKLRKFQ